MVTLRNGWNEIRSTIRNLDRQRISIILLIGFVLGVAYYAYSVTVNTAQLERKSERFADKLHEFKKVQEKLRAVRTQSGKSGIKNPLSYLENQVDQKNIGELTPLGTEENRRLYRLSLESVPLRLPLSLIKTFDSNRGIITIDFNLERISLDSPDFDAYFRLAFPESET